MRSAPGLLHNMSSKPRTSVQLNVEPIDTRVASFALDGLASELSRALKRRTRASQRPLLASFVLNSDLPSLTERLDGEWGGLALRGAVLLYAAVGVPRAVTGTKPCRDPLLVLNVLARARGNVLLPDAPLVLQPRSLDRRVYTDDPRLTSLVYEEQEDK